MAMIRKIEKFVNTFFLMNKANQKLNLRLILSQIHLMPDLIFLQENHGFCNRGKLLKSMQMGKTNQAIKRPFTFGYLPINTLSNWHYGHNMQKLFDMQARDITRENCTKKFSLHGKAFLLTEKQINISYGLTNSQISFQK